MITSQDFRQYAVEQGIAEEEALQAGMTEKPAEFQKSGVEVYLPA